MHVLDSTAAAGPRAAEHILPWQGWTGKGRAGTPQAEEHDIWQAGPAAIRPALQK